MKRRRSERLWQRLTAGAIVCAAVVVLADAPAQASSTSVAVCTARATLNLSGLWYLKATSGTNKSGGETGTLSCLPGSTIDGKAITGTGSVGFDATYTNSTCARVTGGGSWFFTLPTSTGPVKHAGLYDGPAAMGVVVPFQGWFPGGYATGLGPIVPTHGDCLLSPLTTGTLVAVITIITNSG